MVSILVRDSVRSNRQISVVFGYGEWETSHQLNVLLWEGEEEWRRKVNGDQLAVAEEDCQYGYEESFGDCVMLVRTLVILIGGRDHLVLVDISRGRKLVNF